MFMPLQLQQKQTTEYTRKESSGSDFANFVITLQALQLPVVHAIYIVVTANPYYQIIRFRASCILDNTINIILYINTYFVLWIPAWVCRLCTAQGTQALGVGDAPRNAVANEMDPWA